MFRKKMVFDYDKLPLEKRKKEVETIMSMKSHEDKVPIIVQAKSESKLVLTGKSKYLISSNETVNTFMYELRKRLSLPSQKALFIFINDNIPVPTQSKLGDIYSKYKDEDGFLKIAFSEEHTYGC
jgi:GABA(A) receptor-associated protein